MKKAILLSVAVLVNISFGLAQQKQAEYSRPLTGINVVVLSLSGNSTLLLAGSNDLKINSFLTPKGGVWGYQYPARRPEFEMRDRLSGDTLFISSPEKYSPNTIGISNYSEKTDNIILLPEGKKVIIKNAENLKVEGHFEYLDIAQAEYVSVSLNEYLIKELSCVAQKSLKINDEKLSKTFFLKNTGSDTLYINASQIIINLMKNI